MDADGDADVLADAEAEEVAPDDAASVGLAAAVGVRFTVAVSEAGGRQMAIAPPTISPASTAPARIAPMVRPLAMVSPPRLAPLTTRILPERGRRCRLPGASCAVRGPLRVSMAG
jgi:hypothetical protein